MPGTSLFECGLYKWGQLRGVRQPAPSRTNRRDVPLVPPNRFHLLNGPRTLVAGDRSDKHLVLRFQSVYPEHCPTAEANQASPEAEASSRRELRGQSGDALLLSIVRRARLAW